MLKTEDLYKTPSKLAPYYAHFRVEEQLLLTGHSHQAWPDCAFEGQKEAWLDAAALLDRKWSRAFLKAGEVRAGFARLLDDFNGEIALGASTHELVVRFLSALPLKKRPRIVTSDGEFHSLRRQLDRLAEEGVEIVKVRSRPASNVAEALLNAIDSRTAAVMVSSVFYQTGEIVDGLGAVMEGCRISGAELLVDAYHSLNVVPFSLKREGLEDAFVAGGGYKYCQLGEGNCFLRIPKECRLRPVVTGWFGEFDHLESSPEGMVRYGEGHARFAGATYDPTANYRASAVFRFFEEMGLTPKMLREVSQHQIALIAEHFDSLDLDPRIISRERDIPLTSIGGFLVLHSQAAAEVCRALQKRGVHTDYRGDALRLGPAPYLSDQQIHNALEILGEVVRAANI